ncbi:MAG: endonuclease/exonuclease/phosphatase family protein [Bacteroidales bacterium]
MKLLKMLKLTLIIAFLLSANANLSMGQEKSIEKENTLLRLMTYNLKFASPVYEPSWEVRRDMQVDLIRKYEPDIIGIQEGLKEQVDYLMEKLPEYIVVGEGRKGGDDDEHMAIFIKRDKFRLRELQSFQLSKTPEVIGSGPAVNPRMVTWVRLSFLNKTGEGEESLYPQDYRGHWENTQEFYLFNTHFFDRRDQAMARLNAAKLIAERVRDLGPFGEWAPERPVFLMGDFNCRPGSLPYQVLVEGTLNGGQGLFSDTSDEHKEIDWILYRGPVNVLHYEEVDYHVDGVYPSDHNPIYVEFEF